MKAAAKLLALHTMCYSPKGAGTPQAGPRLAIGKHRVSILLLEMGLSLKAHLCHQPYIYITYSE